MRALLCRMFYVVIKVYNELVQHNCEFQSCVGKYKNVFKLKLFEDERFIVRINIRNEKYFLYPITEAVIGHLKLYVIMYKIQSIRTVCKWKRLDLAYCGPVFRFFFKQFESVMVKSVFPIRAKTHSLIVSMHRFKILTNLLITIKANRDRNSNIVSYTIALSLIFIQLKLQISESIQQITNSE